MHFPLSHMNSFLPHRDASGGAPSVGQKDPSSSPFLQFLYPLHTSSSKMQDPSAQVNSPYAHSGSGSGGGWMGSQKDPSSFPANKLFILPCTILHVMKWRHDACNHRTNHLHIAILHRRQTLSGYRTHQCTRTGQLSRFWLEALEHKLGRSRPRLPLPCNCIFRRTLSDEEYNYHRYKWIRPAYIVALEYNGHSMVLKTFHLAWFRNSVRLEWISIFKARWFYVPKYYGHLTIKLKNWVLIARWFLTVPRNSAGVKHCFSNKYF